MGIIAGQVGIILPEVASLPLGARNRRNKERTYLALFGSSELVDPLAARSSTDCGESFPSIVILSSQKKAVADIIIWGRVADASPFIGAAKKDDRGSGRL